MNPFLSFKDFALPLPAADTTTGQLFEKEQ